MINRCKTTEKRQTKWIRKGNCHGNTKYIFKVIAGNFRKTKSVQLKIGMHSNLADTKQPKMIFVNLKKKVTESISKEVYGENEMMQKNN